MKKFFITLPVVALLAIGLSACGSPSTDAKDTKPAAVAETEAPAEEAVAEEPAAPDLTPSQAAAVAKAGLYLKTVPLSRDGMVAQLEFDQFSPEDAAFGADNSGADWNEQAAKKAKMYADTMAMSGGQLHDQLLFDKFTEEQAAAAVAGLGL